MRHNLLIWALPLQALLLFWKLDLLYPWGDEWFTLTTVPQPLDQIASTVAGNIHPPLYYFLLHYWIQIQVFSTLVAKMRAMSVLWILIATVVVYVLWLRREEPMLQRRFLTLWVLSPCLLLHGRMARSYSMQLAIAPVAIYTALHWAEEPRNWRRFLLYGCTNAALLYTHYLSGLAIASAVWLMLLWRKHLVPAAAQVLLLAVLYLPWLRALRASLNKWGAASEAFEGGHLATDQIVRLGYLFVSFSFGEMLSTVSVFLSLALTPALLWALWRGATSRPAWLPVVFLASAFAWVGVSRWSQFPFMPTGLIFALPFFLLLVVRNVNTLVFTALVALYLLADYSYFAKRGFLVKPYDAPYEEMAEVIRNGSKGYPAILAVDSYGSFYEPLVEKLGNNVRVIPLDDEASANAVRAIALRLTSGTSVIWLLRHTRDISPGAFITKLEDDLSQDHRVQYYDLVPYSQPERWIRRLLRGSGQAAFYYRLSEVR